MTATYFLPARDSLLEAAPPPRVGVPVCVSVDGAVVGEAVVVLAADDAAAAAAVPVHLHTGADHLPARVTLRGVAHFLCARCAFLASPFASFSSRRAFLKSFFF